MIHWYKTTPDPITRQANAHYRWRAADLTTTDLLPLVSVMLIYVTGFRDGATFMTDAIRAVTPDPGVAFDLEPQYDSFHGRAA